ncbi:sensor histidine kinase [Undibacterium sp. Ji49W]|uniref:sensor histidine kinase n=1 Tax=Undibacterium sp. Ji49W TaxID=3413040 RepID=UPI003BEFD051
MGLTGTLMLHAGFILFGFVLAIVYTLCRRSKSSSRLVMRLTESNQTARAAHDSLLQNVNSLVLQLHAMAIHFRDEDAVRGALDHILKDAELLVEPGHYQIVGQQILPQYECDLEQMLVELAQALSEDGICQCILIVVGDYSRLYFSMHDDLYRFAREALTNAYRHACAQKVEIELTYTCMSLRLQIRDDGTGFPLLPRLTAGMTGRGGLHTMQKHASDIGGHLYISSGSGLGTEVSLDVPLPAQQEHHYLTATLACMRRHLGFRT